ncbi:hypothetical protein PC9H_010669 [Pleurotus ostreatus]|uniref:Uncharacterized protein n=1 Tax=Pleurotus ostreatus TaxID=5322 RepID=A0A8H6ZPW6_PLEOS|nr:uncharacterized protein PC9H_010669 [Pleurotus ostreatus]KAF7422513.1 hypothetical protein PC9H_010669 [Pleurotus ostreatus]
MFLQRNDQPWMKSVFALAILAATLAAAKPANDWSKPCFDGECAYDLPGTKETGSATLKLSGAAKAITDITPAAGWIVLDCDPHALSQEIRLVCKGDDEASCGHLFEHGPEHKVVRLPESCGAGPFGRIVSAAVAEDQNVPGHVQLVRRDGVEPQVHVLQVDDRWDLADVSKTGDINFTFLGSSITGPVGKMNHEEFNARDVHLSVRSPDGWSAFFTKAIAALKSAAKEIKDGIADKTKVEIELEQIKLVYDSKGEKKHDILPKKEIDCGWGKASVAADITASYQIHAHVGAAITGSLIPPKVNEIATLAGFSGDTKVHLHIKAEAEAQKTVPWPILPPVNPTPLQIPGVISVGPHIQVDASADVAIKLSGDIDIGADFVIKDVEFWYPEKVEKEVHEVTEKPSPWKLNADATAKGSITASVHIIPKISLGIEGLSGNAKANAFVSVDGYVTAEIKGEGHASATKRSHSRDLALRDADTAGAGYSGSIDVKAGVKIKGGIDGKILDLIEKTHSIDIWSTEWPIYKKSWSGGKEKREFSEISSSALVSRTIDSAHAAAGCPALKPSLFTIKK